MLQNIRINEVIFLKKCFACTTLIETVKEEMACCFDLLITSLMQSWKLRLDLLSAKWLKPSLLLVSSFNPSKFWAEEILLGSGIINFFISFLNIWHKDELQIKVFIFGYNCSEKRIFLKKIVFTLKKYN